MTPDNSITTARGTKCRECKRIANRLSENRRRRAKRLAA